MNEVFYQVFFAFTLDLMIADPAFLPHPVRIIGFLIAKFEVVLRRFFKGKPEFAGGVILTLVVTILSYFFVKYLLIFADGVSSYLKIIIGTYFIYASMACRELAERANDVLKSLKKGEPEEARRYLSGLVGRDTRGLDDEGIKRAVIETVAENINDAVVAPLFYAFLGGAPLAVAYRIVNTLDSMVGYRNEKYVKFGFASAKLDDILNFIPARLVGLLFPVVAFILKKDARGCVDTMRRDARKHLSPNSGISEAAMAGALGVRLGGLSFYEGRAVSRSEMGKPIRSLTNGCVSEAIKIHYMISVLALTSLSLINLIFYWRGVRF